LDASKIPTTYTENPPNRRLWSTQQDQINALTDHEGYPQGSTRPTTPDDATIDTLTPVQILDDLAIAFDRFEDNPNKYTNALEVIPSMLQIQQSLGKKVPLTTNQISSYTWPASGNGGIDFRHGELSVDVDSGSVGTKTTAQTYIDNDINRHSSLLRMQSEWATAFYGHIHDDRAADDPSTIYEIKCPTGTQPDGTSVNYFSGTAITTTDTSIIISDSSGISIKDKHTGVVIGSTLDDVPEGTVYREGDGYKVKTTNTFNPAPSDGRRTVKVDGANPAPSDDRRIVEIDLATRDLAFKREVQKVCNKYQARLDRAVKTYGRKARHAKAK
jgi:hypothetical protein